jgi:archaellum component FlaF (FlaF/FlaG flagellin family)
MKRTLFIVFLIGTMISGLVIVSSLYLGKSQDYNESIINFGGTITSNTIWSKTDTYMTRYNITESITIADRVTLTIETGTVVDFNDYNMQVDGTLIAKGSSTNHIYFTHGLSLTFTQSSSPWNEQTGSGSILENVEFANGPHIEIINASPKVNQNYEIGRIHISGGSPVISNNTVYGTYFWNKDANVQEPVSGGQITIDGGSPIISNNTISYGHPLDYQSLHYGISLRGVNTALILDNTFKVLDAAIYISAGAPTIQRNFITSDYNSGIGIIITGNSNPSIKNNTVAESSVGLNIYGDSTSIMLLNNNIQSNNKYNIYLGEQGVFGSTASNLDASNNWWGTIDMQAINQTIYDYKNDINLGKVTYVPFLTEPNPQSIPDPNAPTPTVTPTDSPSSPTPSQETGQTQTEAIIGAAIVTIVLSAGLGLLIYLIKRK